MMTLCLCSAIKILDTSTNKMSQQAKGYESARKRIWVSMTFLLTLTKNLAS